MIAQKKEENLGLSNKEVIQLRKKYGLNEIQGKKSISPIYIFLEQFNDFIIWVLLVATGLSYALGEKADAITIIIIVIMNAILGFIQEFRTEKSLEALKKLSMPKAKVYRNGKHEIIDTREIVPGDIVIVESGDRIPADSYIVFESNLEVDESLLTGESVSVKKRSGNLKNIENINIKEDKNNMVFMGTTVTSGKAELIVLNTGMKTEMGKIAGMLSDIKTEKSPLKEKLDSVGKILVYICFAICILVVVMGVIRGENIADMFLLGVSLAVAAIPEGLAAIVTISLAIGVSRMVKKNVLIRKLPSVETLGSVSVICTDKTGTLTENNMTLREIYFNGNTYKYDIRKKNDEMFKKVITYCNEVIIDEGTNIKDSIGNAVEKTLIEAYYKSADEFIKEKGKAKRLYDNPFNSDRKKMSVIVRENGKDVAYIKGATEKLIEGCTKIYENGNVVKLDEFKKRRIYNSLEEMSSRALRCIGLAYKTENIRKDTSIEKDMIFIGIAGIIDPPRKEVKDSIEKCKRAGINTIMVTGDHRKTAFAVGYEIGIAKSLDETMEGSEIDKLSDEELSIATNKIKIFARVTPNHKLRIVEAVQRNGKVVAMTGDGVNDAPAIKKANIGISMGISGTDVTKESSSMILLDDNFSSIVHAVEEGRNIYNNIRKFIRYLLSCNLGEVLTMFLASLFALKVPLLPIQILFVNLATDGLPAIALGLDGSVDDLMSKKPRDKKESIFADGLLEKILIRGTLIGVCTIFAYIASIYLNLSLETSRTIALSTLVLSQLFHVFECKSENVSIININPFSNMYLVISALISLIMLLSSIYVPYLGGIFKTTPLSINEWGIVIFFSGIIAVLSSIFLSLKNNRKSK